MQSPSCHLQSLPNHTKTSSYPKKDELIPHFFDNENSILPPPIAEINTGNMHKCQITGLAVNMLGFTLLVTYGGHELSPKLNCASSNQNPLSPPVFHVIKQRQQTLVVQRTIYRRLKFNPNICLKQITTEKFVIIHSFRLETQTNQIK